MWCGGERGGVGVVIDKVGVVPGILQESALVKSNMDLMHIEREKDQLASEVSQRKQELETTKKLMDSQQAEEAKLRKIITEASAEITRQKKELEKVSVA